MNYQEIIRKASKEVGMNKEETEGCLLLISNDLLGMVPTKLLHFLEEENLLAHTYKGVSNLIVDDIGEWSWVVDDFYPILFELTKKGNKKSSIINMKRFMREYPSVTKDEILAATTLYRQQRISTNSYSREPQYFIRKKLAGSYISDLEEMIETVRNLKAKRTPEENKHSSMSIS